MKLTMWQQRFVDVVAEYNVRHTDAPLTAVIPTDTRWQWGYVWNGTALGYAQASSSGSALWDTSHCWKPSRVHGTGARIQTSVTPSVTALELALQWKYAAWVTKGRRTKPSMWASLDEFLQARVCGTRVLPPADIAFLGRSA